MKNISVGQKSLVGRAVLAPLSELLKPVCARVLAKFD